MPPIRCKNLTRPEQGGWEWWHDAGRPMWCSRCMGRAPNVTPCSGDEWMSPGRPYNPTDNYEDDYEIPYDPNGTDWGRWNPDGPYTGPEGPGGGGCG